MSEWDVSFGEETLISWPLVSFLRLFRGGCSRQHMRPNEFFHRGLGDPDQRFLGLARHLDSRQKAVT